MSDNHNFDQGTHRLDPSDIEPFLEKYGDQYGPDQPVPWVIDLRVVGTPLVIQSRIGGELVIGRKDPKTDYQPDIDLEPFGGLQKGVSRRHAVIYPKNNRLMLRDLNSSNGTYINGKILQGGQEHRLRHNDTLTIGKIQIQVVFAVMPASINSIDTTHPINFNIPKIGSGQQILVVDQDDEVATVLCGILQRAGFSTIKVKTFAEAVSVMDDEVPAAVITELLLPDMSGLDLVQHIRQHLRQSNIPILIVTSVTAGYQMSQAIDAGADVYLFKPVGMDEILNGISKFAAQM